MALIGKDLFVHHFVFHWVGPHEPITVPFTLWVLSYDCGEAADGPVRDRPNSWARWYRICTGYVCISLSPFPVYLLRTP